MSVAQRRSASGRVALVALVGDHDISTSHEVRRALSETRGAELVVVDLGDCTFVDSTVLGVLVTASKRVAASGGRLFGVNADGVVRKALAVTGVGPLIVGTSELEQDEEVQSLLVREERPAGPLV